MLLSFQEVALGYGRQEIVKGLTFSVNRGDFFGIVGPNGAGKTTLLKTLLGLLKPLQGTITGPAARPVRFGYCIQRQSVDEIFPFTVHEIVMMGRTNLLGPLVKPGPDDFRKVDQCLEAAGIQALAEQRFTELSGGQQQRALVARALATDPDCLVLDEPTNELDIKGSREIMDFIQTLHRDLALTVILVSHELDRVLNYADRFLLLNQEGKPYTVDRDKLTERLLEEVFQVRVKLYDTGEGMVIL